MKIVGKSNHNKETMSDVLICDNVNGFYAIRIKDFLNKDVFDFSPTIYEIVDDDYVLYEYDPNS